MSALYVCLLRRHRATKMYVSMSVSVQCLCADVEGNDVPTIWCIRQNVYIYVCCYVLLCTSLESSKLSSVDDCDGAGEQMRLLGADCLSSGRCGSGGITMGTRA